MPVPRSSLYLWSGQAVLIGNAAEAVEHQHHALQVAIGLSGPFRLHSRGAGYEDWAAIIASDQPHRFDCPKDWEAVVLIDPETIVARRLADRYLQRTSISTLSWEHVEPFMPELSTYAYQVRSSQQAKDFFDSLLGSLAGPPTVANPLDPRIQSALALASGRPLRRVATKDVAAAVYLSENRLIHLFKQQVGISWRSYLLWARLIDAVVQIAHGVPLTSAAHQAGFADSAHLSRTFKRMFGMTPSEVFKNDRFVQVISGP